MQQQQQNTEVDFIDTPVGEQQTDYDENSSGEVEKEARIYGWVPKESFRGDESEWVDAETFVQRGKAINPILRKNNEVLMKKFTELERRLQEKEITMQQFAKYHQETEKRAYEKALSELKEQKKEAISMGDGEKVVEIDEALADLRSSQQNTQQSQQNNSFQPPPPDPTFVAWSKENDWYVNDKRLRNFADIIGAEVREDRPDLFGIDFLEEVKQRVQEEFPNKFEKKFRQSPAEGTTGGSRSSGGKKTAKDLPPDVRKVMEEFIKEGLVTEQQYLKEYFA